MLQVKREQLQEAVREALQVLRARKLLSFSCRGGEGAPPTWAVTDMGKAIYESALPVQVPRPRLCCTCYSSWPLLCNPYSPLCAYSPSSPLLCKEILLASAVHITPPGLFCAHNPPRTLLWLAVANGVNSVRASPRVRPGQSLLCSSQLTGRLAVKVQGPIAVSPTVPCLGKSLCLSVR